VDEVTVEHREQRVDALLGAQPAGVEDPDGRRAAGRSRLTAEAGFRERVDHLDRREVDVEEVRPQLRGEPAGGDQVTVPGGDPRPMPVLFAQWWWDVQDLVRRAPGRHDGELGDEDDGAVELTDIGHRGQRLERDPDELVPADGGAEPDGDHLCGHAAPIQLPDVPDGVVLRTTGARGEGWPGSQTKEITGRIARLGKGHCCGQRLGRKHQVA